MTGSISAGLPLCVRFVSLASELISDLTMDPLCNCLIELDPMILLLECSPNIRTFCVRDLSYIDSFECVLLIDCLSIHYRITHHFVVEQFFKVDTHLLTQIL